MAQESLQQQEQELEDAKVRGHPRSCRWHASPLFVCAWVAGLLAAVSCLRPVECRASPLHCSTASLLACRTSGPASRSPIPRF